MAINKPIHSVIEQDLLSLIANQESERKTLDYKQTLKLDPASEKKEFLYDVSSFANASGGHLIYGIEEVAGIPTNLNGLDIADLDAQILRLESIIRDGIAPRIPGVVVHSVSLTNGKNAIVIHIPRSWARPHMVKFQDACKFYSRDTRGKYLLDVDQIRAAFALSQTTAEQLRTFRQERLGLILAGETPIRITSAAKLVLHIIPVAAFDFASKFDVVSLWNNPPSPLTSGSFNRRLNFFGLVSYDAWDEHSASGYLQIFRNGIIEAVDTNMLGRVQNGQGIIQHIISPDYESMLLKDMPGLLSIQETLGVEPPLFIMLSFLGVKGYQIILSDYFGLQNAVSIDQDALIIGEEMIEGFRPNLANVMKPIFDIVWNSAGWHGSRNYDNKGNWTGRR